MDSLDAAFPLLTIPARQTEVDRALTAFLDAHPAPDLLRFDLSNVTTEAVAKAQRAATLLHCVVLLEIHVANIIREHGPEATMSHFSTGAVAGLRSVIYDLRALAEEGHGG